MAEYTKQQLMMALRKADDAGDSDGARRIAQMISSAKEPEESGVISSIKDAFTGESRETRATRELPELFEGAGFLSTGDATTAAKVTPALLTTTEPQEMADILSANYPEIGIQYDEKGNIIAANNKTGQRVVLNKPGMSGTDVANILGIGLLSIPAGASGAGGAARVGQIAGQTGLMTAAQEVGQLAVGGEFDLENVLIDTAGAGALEAIPAIIKAAKVRQSGRTDKLTDEAVTAEASRLGDELSPEQQLSEQTRIAEETAKQAQARKPDVRTVAAEVLPDQKITDAAERLGVADELTPGQVSSSQTYRELEGALSAIPASQLGAQQKQAIEAVAQKADDLITEFGGVTDKSALSESVRDRVAATVSDLSNQAEVAYGEIATTIPSKAKVITSDIAEALRAEANDLGGEEFLEPLQRRTLKVADGEPSYALIDKERKKIGAALNKKQGPYKDMDSGMLKRMYGMLTKAQESTAKQHGASELWDTAKGLVSQRKAIEDQSVELFGKDLAGALMPKVGRAMKQLSAGDFKNFDKLINAIPKDQREAVVLSALNDVFTSGSRAEKQLSPAGFVDWYESLNRNKAAFKRITLNLPDGAAQRLDDLYQVSRGIRNLSKERVRTGVIQGLLSDFDKADGMLSKLYKTGRTLAAAEGATSAAGLPGAGTAGVMVDILSKGKGEPVTKAADSLLSSNEFKKAITSYAGKSVRSEAKQKAAQKALEKSEKYQRWLNLMPDEDKRSIIRFGLIPWLSEESKQPK